MPSLKGKPLPGIGVDIGGVIIRPARVSGDTSFFSSGYLDTPIIDGALEAIRTLNEKVYPGRVFLVSKAKSGTAQKTREWLAHKGFYDATGITAEKLFFCDKREGKVPIARRLGLTAFIDDRVDVLQHLSAIKQRYLFATKKEHLAPNTPKDLTPVIGWEKAITVISSHV